MIKQERNCRQEAEGKKIAQISRIVGLSRPTIYRVLESA
jgi:predicted DNA-binding transcriptional regulator AlpA